MASGKDAFTIPHNMVEFVRILQRLSVEDWSSTNIVGDAITFEKNGATGDGVTDDTTAVQDTFDEAVSTGKPIIGAKKTYLIDEISISGPVVFRGAGSKATIFNRKTNGVAATAVSGGSLSSGTYFTMIFGLNDSNTVVGAYSPLSGTVNGSSTTAIRYTWPAIDSATKYRLWVGTTRYSQTSYFETAALTYDITSTSGTGGTRPDWDTPMFRMTPHASRHSVMADFSLGGANRASHGILWEGTGSYLYTGYHARIWSEFFYEAAIECRDAASFGRFDNVVMRTARVGFYGNSVDDHQLSGCDFGVCDYGWDFVTAVNNEIFRPNAYSTNFGGGRFQAGANRNKVISGSINLNKQHGIIDAGTQNVTVATKFADNSSLTTNTYSDIYITGDAGVHVAPIFIPGSGGKLPKYNIEITGAVTAQCIGETISDTPYGTAFTSDATKLRSVLAGVPVFGSYTAGAATDSTGYITIIDAAGNTRKLMVQA